MKNVRSLQHTENISSLSICEISGFSLMKHQLDATLCRFYFCRVTLHVSVASAHHQKYLKLVQRPLVHVLSLQVRHHISLLGPSGPNKEMYPTTQRPTTAINHIQQNQRITSNAVTHGLCSPEDGHNDARNMLRQKLIINIWLLHLVGFLSLHTLLTMHGHRNLNLAIYAQTTTKKSQYWACCPGLVLVSNWR